MKGFVLPEYNGRSIANIPGTVLRLFGIQNNLESLAAPILNKLSGEYSSIIFLIIDGVGFYRYRELKEQGVIPNLAGFNEEYLTSVFPSTTTAALTSLSTGVPPAKHGMLGFKLFLKDFGVTTNMISFRPWKIQVSLVENGLDPDEFVKERRVYSYLEEGYVKSYILIRNFYRNTPLSRVIYGSHETYGIINSVDLFTTILKIHKKDKQKKFIVAYWGDTDTLAHRYGERSLEFELELRNLDFLLGETLKKLQGENVLFLITADHGHIDTVPEKAIDLSEDKFLQEEMVLPPGGEHRVVYLAVRNPEKVVKYLRGKYGDLAEVALREELETRSLWGGELGNFSSRVGDVILLARENNSFVYPENDEEKMMIGRHGGLSYEEMVVPFLWKRL